MNRPQRYFLGLDLGQAQDYTALAVLEQVFVPDPDKPGAHLQHYACRHLERLALGTAYTAVAARLRGLTGTGPLRGGTLVVDQTGVGRAVVDLLRAARLPVQLRAVTITAGHATTVGTDGSLHVPKKELVGALLVLLHTKQSQCPLPRSLWTYLRVPGSIHSGSTTTRGLAAAVPCGNSRRYTMRRDHDRPPPFFRTSGFG